MLSLSSTPLSSGIVHIHQRRSLSEDIRCQGLASVSLADDSQRVVGLFCCLTPACCAFFRTGAAARSCVTRRFVEECRPACARALLAEEAFLQSQLQHALLRRLTTAGHSSRWKCEPRQRQAGSVLWKNECRPKMASLTPAAHLAPLGLD